MLGYRDEVGVGGREPQVKKEKNQISGDSVDANKLRERENEVEGNTV